MSAIICTYRFNHVIHYDSNIYPTLLFITIIINNSMLITIYRLKSFSNLQNFDFIKPSTRSNEP